VVFGSPVETRSLHRFAVEPCLETATAVAPRHHIDSCLSNTPRPKPWRFLRRCRFFFAPPECEAHASASDIPRSKFLCMMRFPSAARGPPVVAQLTNNPASGHTPNAYFQATRVTASRLLLPLPAAALLPPAARRCQIETACSPAGIGAALKNASPAPAPVLAAVR